MTRGAHEADERVLELFADLALQGLDAQGRSELQALLAQRAAMGLPPPTRDATTLEIAAASVALACSEKSFAPMPEHLAARVHAGAQAFFAPGAAPPSLAPRPMPGSAPPPTGPVSRPALPGPMPENVVPLRPKRDLVRWSGWLAAAACFLLAAFAFWRASTVPRQAAAPRPAEQRKELLAQKEAVKIDFTTTKDPSAASAKGDVVWSAAASTGYMRIEGLAANDPTKEQYQLWIFDEAQDEKTPVDGGVFDVVAGEVVIPIQAKLKVKKATLFAITVEKPGGVPVSKRERIVLVAKPG
jgi:hypothetical protein